MCNIMQLAAPTRFASLTLVPDITEQRDNIQTRMLINEDLTAEEFAGVVRLFQILLQIDQRIQKSKSPTGKGSLAKME